MKLTRFLDAQNQVYLRALSEIRAGRKTLHWMWYVFPQLKGLGHSETSQFYGLDGLEEAAAYLAHPVLGRNLIEISCALLELRGRTATEIFGSPDDLKLRSSMTLFANFEDTDPVFAAVLDIFFDGKQDSRTMEMIRTNRTGNDAV